MYQQAKAANEEALQIYEDLQHPELGAMYTVLGNMAIDRYRNLPRGAERLENLSCPPAPISIWGGA